VVTCASKHGTTASLSVQLVDLTDWLRISALNIQIRMRPPGGTSTGRGGLHTFEPTILQRVENDGM
jgi:hypothetical protein